MATSSKHKHKDQKPFYRSRSFIVPNTVDHPTSSHSVLLERSSWVRTSPKSKRLKSGACSVSLKCSEISYNAHGDTLSKYSESPEVKLSKRLLSPQSKCSLTSRSPEYSARMAQSHSSILQTRPFTQQRSNPPPSPSSSSPQNPSIELRLNLTLGNNCRTPSCLTVNPVSGLLAYPSSGVVVFFDALNGGQMKYTKAVRKITCLNFSPDGRLLVVGETSHKPALIVWDPEKDESVAQLYGQTFGHIATAFSNKMDLLVSVGTKFDGLILIWAWPSQIELASNRFKERIYNMSFSETDIFFVTCGQHHVKFWYPKPLEGKKLLCMHTDVLSGRPALLEDLKTLDFTDIACGNGISARYVYTITKCGLICQISEQRTILGYKRLRDNELCSLKIWNNEIIVGTACGHVFFLEAMSITLLRTVSHPVDICLAEQILSNSDTELRDLIQKTKCSTFVAIDPNHSRLTVLMANGTLCIWDVTHLERIKKINYLMSHSQVVSSMELMHHNLVMSNRETLLTASHDGTLRLWSISMARGICCDSNKTLYMKLQSDFINPVDPSDNSRSQSTAYSEPLPKDDWAVSPSMNALDNRQDFIGNPLDRRSNSSASLVSVESKGTVAPETRRITVFKVVSGREYIVLGDSRGYLFAYKVKSFVHVNTMKRHSRAISALALFSQDGRRLVISGGRDMKICMFSTDNQFSFITAVCFHSSTVTQLVTLSTMYSVGIISAGREGSVIMSRIMGDRLIVSGTVHLNSHAVALCADNKHGRACIGSRNSEIRIVDMSTSHVPVVARFYASKRRSGVHLYCLTLNVHMNFLFTACSDRTINILHYPTGILITSVTAHISMVTALAVSSNMRYVISTSRDGCIFFWRIQPTPSHVNKVLFSRWRELIKSRLMKAASKKRETVKERNLQCLSASECVLTRNTKSGIKINQHKGRLVSDSVVTTH